MFDLCQTIGTNIGYNTGVEWVLFIEHQQRMITDLSQVLQGLCFKNNSSEHGTKNLDNLVTPEIHVSAGQVHLSVADQCQPSKHCQLLFWLVILKSLHTAPPKNKNHAGYMTGCIDTRDKPEGG